MALVQFDRAAQDGPRRDHDRHGVDQHRRRRLRQHLKGKDFFNAEQFPTAKFVADRFVFEGDKVAEVGGTLTLLGKTLPVTLKASNFNCYTNPVVKREVCGGDFDTTIARSQWGMDWGLKFGFPDQVRLLVQVEAIKQ